MHYQMTNSDLNQTMQSNIILDRAALLSEISKLKNKIAQFQQVLKKLDDQQANNISSAFSSSNLQNTSKQHFSQKIREQQNRAHKSQGLPKYSKCIIHNRESTRICYTCKTDKCQVCCITECFSHQLYSKQKGLQKFANQLFQLQAPKIEEQLKSYKRLINCLEKQRIDLKKEVNNAFLSLQKMLQTKKKRIMLYIDEIIQVRVEQTNNLCKKFLNIFQDLNKSKIKQYQPKNIKDFVILSSEIAVKFNNIKQQSKTKTKYACEVIDKITLFEKILQVELAIQKIQYRFDSSQKKTSIQFFPMRPAMKKKIEAIQQNKAL